MKIAVPVTKGVLSSHFGHCEQFVLFEVGTDGKTLGGSLFVETPRIYRVRTAPSAASP
jgi:hypothetical protein